MEVIKVGNTIVRLYQKQNFVIGEDILKAIKLNNLTLDEAILIIYFCSNNSHPEFDIEEIKNKFGIDEVDAMKAFESISNKGLISINMQKNKEGKLEEVIDLTPFYESIAVGIDEKVKKSNHDNIFTSFENEFARPLSSMEYELINNWIKKGISEDLILTALKEAIFNGTLTLRYIDSILSEWQRKGFKTSNDVSLYLKKKSAKEKKLENTLFDYNWLDEE